MPTTKSIKTKNKFIIALTVQNLINDGYSFEENEKGSIVVKNEEGKVIKTLTTEKELQEWIDKQSLNF